ncbi:MAG: hypothetical protein ABIY37_13505 [Devosia sp.]
MTLRPLPFLRASLMVAAVSTCPTATAQQAPADRQDAALVYAQCMRDNGYAEFPDPDSDGGFQFLINPKGASRFHAAAAACHDLAPEGMRDEEVTPEQIDALIKLSQCVRENGVPEFPDPGPQGNYDLSGTDIGPGDTRLEAAMAVCRDETGPGPGMRITIGG